MLVGCGGGLIEEKDVAKNAIGEGWNVNARLALRAAVKVLRSMLGLELVRCTKAPTAEALTTDKENPLSEAKLEPAWLLRRPPPRGASGAGALRAGGEAGAASVDGLTAAQRGLLGVVLSLVLLESAKAIREDRLWATLALFDPARFAIAGGKEGASRRGGCAGSRG